MSYADTDYANTYHAFRLSGEAWTALSPAIQAAALLSASEALDAYAASKGGWLKDYTENTPVEIKNACCMEALALTDRETSERMKAQAQGVQSTSMGSASESYTGQGAALILANTRVATMLKSFLRQAGGGVAIL